MIRVALNGANGKMCRVINSIIKTRTDCEVTVGFDIIKEQYDTFPIYDDFSKSSEDFDVMIDFSHTSVLEGLLSFCKSKNKPVVVATTGFNDNQINTIKEYGQEIPVFFTFNMSLGINLLEELAKKAALVLGDQFDIEIIEKHHNQKIDAPSGTAFMLANSINTALDDKYKYIYDRHSVRRAREKNEIGIHSIRGGTIVGEHEVIFAGRDEVITLSHSASSKEVFAVGAVNAAVFLSGCTKGVYNMANLID